MKNLTSALRRGCQGFYAIGAGMDRTRATAPQQRLDRLLVERGLCESRVKAIEAIANGRVRLNGRVLDKPAQRVAISAELEVEAAHSWVSRAAGKLLFALSEFGVAAEGRTCLDVGASTGGFTEVLLAQGAARVFAVDVGRAQLHPRLRADGRVVNLEGQDARTLRDAQIAPAPSLVVCDASFIGADKVLARPFALAAPAAIALVLIKPPYEAGPGLTVTDAMAPQIAAVAAARLDGLCGFALRALRECPVRGADGTVEFIAHLGREAA